MNTEYDIVMRENDFLLYANHAPLLTAKGNEVSHRNIRLLRLAMMHEISKPGELFSPLEFLKELSDKNTGSKEVLDSACLGKALDEDPVLQKKEQNTMGEMEDLIGVFPSLIDLVFVNAASVSSALSGFLSRKPDKQTDREFILAEVQSLTREQGILLKCLIDAHQSGLVLHLLLLTGHLAASEYAPFLLIHHLKANPPDSPEEFNALKGKGLVSLQESYFHKAMLALDFLTLCKSDNATSVIEEIINRGEDNQTEFKSTLRWDLYQAKKNPAVEHASLKSICAFLNSEGGDLLIGVRDDGSIEGIETDQFDNDDRFLLHLWTLIKTCMGQEVVEWVKTSLQKIGNRTVCRVHCRKATRPVFLNQKGFEEAFYVRVGPSSSSLEISSALKYIKEHF